MPAKLSIKPTPNIGSFIYTDASEYGGRVHEGVTSMEGRWPDDDTYHHINVLELLAIELALKAFLNNSNKKHVRIFSDNTPLR